MKKFLSLYLDDLFFITGCLCILHGLSMFSAIVMWIVAGIMLITFGFMFAKEMAKNVVEEPTDNEQPED